MKPDPSQPARRVIDLTGLPGNSDRAGYQRLYLTTRLDYYAEFLSSDVVYSEAVPAERSPFPGHEATRVSIGRDATIHYIWARSSQPVDEFDLDIRLGARAAGPAALLPATHPPAHTCLLPDGTCATCDGTCDTCPITHCGDTCPRTACNTCQTCATHCPQQATCAGHGTCVNTQCVQPACVFTQGGQATCANTQCGQATCATCPVQHTCAMTCF